MEKTLRSKFPRGRQYRDEVVSVHVEHVEEIVSLEAVVAAMNEESGLHKSILQEAAEIVEGVRRKSYDHPYDNHRRIAGLLNILWEENLKKDLTPRQIAMGMICVKLAREIHASKRDNGVDTAGYCQVISEIDAESERRQDGSSGCWHRS